MVRCRLRRRCSREDLRVDRRMATPRRTSTRRTSRWTASRHRRRWCAKQRRGNSWRLQRSILSQTTRRAHRAPDDTLSLSPAPRPVLPLPPPGPYYALYSRRAIRAIWAAIHIFSSPAPFAAPNRSPSLSRPGQPASAQRCRGRAPHPPPCPSCEVRHPSTLLASCLSTIHAAPLLSPARAYLLLCEPGAPAMPEHWPVITRFVRVRPRPTGAPAQRARVARLLLATACAIIFRHVLFASCAVQLNWLIV